MFEGTGNMDRSGSISNWFLKPLMDRIEIVAGEPRELLIRQSEENAVPLSLEQFGTAIDWSSLPHCEVEFDYEGSEAEVRASLSVSDLLNCDRLMVITSQDEPVLLVATEVFFENWYSFWAASGYMQLIVLSKDGRFFMEFEDNSSLLYSNFKIG